MSQVVGLPNNSYKPIINTAWLRSRLATASDTVYQLIAHGRWFSPGTPASSTTKTRRHDIAESGVKYNKTNQIKYIKEEKTGSLLKQFKYTVVAMDTFVK